MKYFATCRTLEDLKAEYRRLAMQNHRIGYGEAECDLIYRLLYQFVEGTEAD